MPLIAREHVYNSGNHQVRVKGLFKETVNQVKEEQKGHDKLSCISSEHIFDDEGKVKWFSLERLFMDMVPNDPTEYTFAVEVFGSVKAWEIIQRHPLLPKKLPEWRKEVAKGLRAKGVQYMIEEVSEGGKDSFRAAKFLIDKGWVDDAHVGPGRPKKRVPEEEQKEEDRELLESMSEDAQRLGLEITVSKKGEDS